MPHDHLQRIMGKNHRTDMLMHAETYAGGNLVYLLYWLYVCCQMIIFWIKASFFCFWVKPILLFGRVGLTTNAAMHSCGYTLVTMHLWGTEWINQSIHTLAFKWLLNKVSQTCQNSKNLGRENSSSSDYTAPSPPPLTKKTVQPQRCLHATEKGRWSFGIRTVYKRQRQTPGLKSEATQKWLYLQCYQNSLGARLQKALTPIHSHSFSIMKYSFNNFNNVSTAKVHWPEIWSSGGPSENIYFDIIPGAMCTWPTDSPVLSDDLRLRVGWIDFHPPPHLLHQII